MHAGASNSRGVTATAATAGEARPEHPYRLRRGDDVSTIFGMASLSLLSPSVLRTIAAQKNACCAASAAAAALLLLFHIGVPLLLKHYVAVLRDAKLCSFFSLRDLFSL